MFTRFVIGRNRPLIYLIEIVISFTIYSVIIYFLYYFFEKHHLAIPLSIATIIGTAISILLGFRTSAAYERWWEARKIWGSIINESRTLIRQADGFIASDSEKVNSVQKLASYQIAWCYALTTSLRRLPLSSEVKTYLSQDELKSITSHSNVPNAILKLMGNHLAMIFKQGKLNPIHYSTLDHTLRLLCDNMGRCERIKNTVFPVHYRFISQMAIFLFALLLPFCLVDMVGAYSILITFLVVGAFSIIELIAWYLQDPFENRPTDISMTAISRIIEINLLQMIGEKDIPEPIKPDKKGIIM